MPVAEKKEKLLRRTGTLDFAQQVSDHSPGQLDAGEALFEVTADTGDDWSNCQCECCDPPMVPEDAA
jgi:hypothetical protein